MNFIETTINKSVKSIDCIVLEKPRYFDLENICSDLQMGCIEDIEVGYNPFNIQQLQNYYPIYDYLFSEKIKENNYNYNNIFLNHSNIFRSINTIISLDELKNNNLVECKYQEKNVFLKFAPLLDPIRYMIGKYDNIQKYITNDSSDDFINPILPQFSYKSSLIQDNIIRTSNNSNEIENKINSPHNSCYVDGFFSFLSSHLYNEYKFINGIDFYGSHLGIQELYKMNVVDDIEYMESSDYFQKQINNLFFIEPKITIEPCNNNNFSSSHNSRNQKPRIKIDVNEKDIISDDLLEDIMESIENNDVKLNETCSDIEEQYSNSNELIYEKPDNQLDEDDSEEDCLDEKINELIEIKDTCYKREQTEEFISLNNKDVDKTDDSCDSIDSDDTNEIENNDEIKFKGKDNNNVEDSDNNDETHNNSENSENNENNENSEYSESEYSDEDDEKPVFAYIKNFPVQMICLEKCDGTLDELLLQEQLNEQESISAMFQIVITLAVYQKTFHFTHNDLHTNNIVYIRTKQPFLFYQFSSKIYKVPTYGYIFKIIDFGRSIYTVNGKVLCSDSFSLKGDAETQYNCEPFYNPNKNRVEPNDSFDLCRLGCSIYDFLFDNDEKLNPKKLTDFEKIIYEWCLDDKKQNILYKKNGDERYLHFKLYKMIARNVHHCVPSQELEKIVFKQFLFNANLKKKERNMLIDLDLIPVMV